MKLSALILVLALVGCEVPTKEDLVRENRMKYPIELGDDTFINPETNTLVYEVKVKNMAGDLVLNDLTVDIEILDEGDNVIFSTRKTLDVSSISKNGTKSFTFSQRMEQEGLVAASGLVLLAPDTEGSGYQDYPEFQRIAK